MEASENESGIGDIINNNEGKLLAAFSIHLVGGKNNWEKYRALQYGLDLAEVDGLKNIIVEVDSILLVTSVIEKKSTIRNMQTKVEATKKRLREE